MGSTVIMVVCYALVLAKIRKTRQAVAGATSSTLEAKKKAKEARLAIQFIVIALVYVLVWAMFRILPHIIGSSSREAYVIIPLLANANCSVNPVIYLGKSDKCG
ncbi:MAG: G-protein coupled receptor [Gammaproteobacteria bacterium]|nr:G-protein coupled receptor [Gammaproteobacteria bacterium]